MARTMPARLALFARVTLLAEPLPWQRPVPVRPVTASRQSPPSFAAAIALARHYRWGQAHFPTASATPDLGAIPHALLHRSTDTFYDGMKG
jgi:hypothetical protein